MGLHLVLSAAAQPRPVSEPGAWTAPLLEDLWNRHGGSVYALACALVGSEAAASRAVTLAMVDLSLSADVEPPAQALRSLARRVYQRSQEVSSEPSGTPYLSPVMAWLGQLAQLQRACLALCLLGGHTHREAADLLGVPHEKVADLLTAGLGELGHRAVGWTTTGA